MDDGFASHNLTVRIVAAQSELAHGLSGVLLRGLGFPPEVVTPADVPHLSIASACRSIFVVVCPSDGAGHDAIHFIRNSFRESGICALVDGADQDLAARLLECGADFSLGLPVRAVLLAAAVNALARRILNDWPLPGTRLHLSRQNFVVRIGATVVPLRKTEFLICEYLIMNRGRWVSEKELLNEVLEVNPCRVTSVIRVHMRKIRQSLGHLAVCIRSKRGYGYQFVMPALSERELARNAAGNQHD